METYRHVDFLLEDGARGRVQEQDALQQIQGRHDQDVVLAIWGWGSAVSQGSLVVGAMVPT